ncbi:hypothetical protein TK0098 [Thermococcus kodakarensis KOD1]|uniref:Uncharacterized protein n=1 Tax=Thermococcus kodakarensis (strain ATCC BAA-918 / JCM 12380 / KOD1) TaxID=69014 RepID=Q5JEI8_THEKO|nr:hypothetical protein [Thermococcus kodakarensis]WCN28212.1 hypothetical protein POG15_00520 [Thermococcus kodakarensis]WCN30509.1 hypothetical protein POG21_00520 [Thermococcus kodakarensis]BAD84287.1 hypothetical protein TK0098 [Thermococcus kodakarensis KOD1]
MTKILVFTRYPHEKVWVYSGDCFDASEVDKVCEILRNVVKEGKLHVKIETWPDKEVRDLCRRGRS